MATAGIHTLSVDVRGHGETGGNFDNWSGSKWKEARKQWWPGDLNAAFEFLVSQPGVTRDVIGIGGAGLLGVDNSVETARHHATEVKSLVLVSGETLRPQLQFLHEASQLPELFVVSDEDEYPPTQQAMQLLYDIASSPSKKLIHYSAAKEAPWLWYEPFDIGKVPAKGGHGTDLFKPHLDLPGIIVDWFVTTLIKTPGHAPADSIACAATLTQLQAGSVDQVAETLTEARQKDPHAQLFPEITAGIIGFDYIREGDLKSAIAVLKLVATAYPDSADANGNLADAYFAAGQKDLAKQYADKAQTILNAHKFPASSWADSDEYRGEVRRGVEKTLKKLTSSDN
ncbi:MAG TPA: tetratricopeptide repeat protein [Candidatus Acidoferrum sp.]|nr:tetratricopeptide repeat protein [Candidatus Acidoferrum sp.]